MTRKSWAAKKMENVAANSELLTKLETMSSWPSEPCPCGKITEHERCRKCGACEPTHGKSMEVWGNYRVVAIVYQCGSCEAKPNLVVHPLYQWEPRETFAAKIGREFAEKIKNGWKLSPKQIAMAERLFAEGHKTGPVLSSECPALVWLSVSSPAFKPVYKLVAKESFGFFAMAKGGLGKDSLEKEDIALIRKFAASIIEERTGYAVLSTTEEYGDALRGASGDKVLGAAIEALFETHCWLIREKRITEMPISRAA